MTFSGHRLLKGFLHSISQKNKTIKPDQKEAPVITPESTPDVQERDLTGDSPCGLPRPLRRTEPCKHCFNRHPNSKCGLLGSEARYTFGMMDVVGAYNSSRDVTQLKYLRLYVITYQNGECSPGERGCKNCSYPPTNWRAEFKNKDGQTQTVNFTVGTGYLNGLENCGGSICSPLIVAPDPDLEPFEWSGAGCLGPDGCNGSPWDFQVTFSYHKSDNPDLHKDPEDICKVRLSDYNGMAPLDLAESYQWGVSRQGGINIALRQETCESDGCGPDKGSRPSWGMPAGGGSSAHIHFGFSTYSRTPCPC